MTNSNNRPTNVSNEIDSTLDWPPGFERTPIAEREPYPHNFTVDQRKAFRKILTELDRLGAKDVQIETAADHLKNEPNIPQKHADPEDTGVVVHFTVDDEDFIIPCDRWESLRDNAQAIAKYLDAKRAIDRYGVETATNELAANQLPQTTTSRNTDLSMAPHNVLNVPADASRDMIKQAARQLKAEYHPDNGGDPRQFQRIQRAEEQMLE
jgi:hypothetical protein